MLNLSLITLLFFFEEKTLEFDKIVLLGDLNLSLNVNNDASFATTFLKISA